MKKNARLLLILLLIGVMVFSLVGCGSKPAPAPADEALDAQEVLMAAAKTYFEKVANDNNIISAEALKEMLDTNPDAVLILDIRSAEDFEAGHIPGAVHSGWGKVGEIMDRIPQNKQVIVACYSGQTAGQTVALLRMAGFENVKSLRYGMKLGWVEGEEYAAEGTGMVAAADLPSVSSPDGEEQEILWQAAKDVFADIAGGNRALLDPKDLYTALQDNPYSYYVLDIRSADDFAAGHIEYSVHSPWAKVGELLEELPTNMPIVIGCYSGQTAGQTVGVLRMLDFSVESLLYGVRDGWVEREGLPVVTE